MWPTNSRASAMEPAPPDESRGLEAMDKSSEAYRTISEAADELDLPQHVLRFWETRFPQVRPLKRGGGRRFYRPDDLDLLRAIRHLLYGEGYTIRGVQKMLKEQGPRGVIAQALATGGGGPRASTPDPRAFDPEDDVDQAGDHEPDLAPEHDAEFAPTLREEPSLFVRESAAAPVRQSPRAEPPAALTLPLFHPEPEPGAFQQARSSRSPALGEEDLRRLESALAELEECRRLLSAAAA